MWHSGPLSLATNLTWQEARDRGADPIYYGKALPYLSDWEFFADLDLQLGSWRPGTTLIHQSPNYRDRYNQEINRAPARTLWHLALARVWKGGLGGKGRVATLTAEVLNVTDNQVYDVEGYPLPGRSVRLSLHWR
jgi:hypothetical protein